MSPNGPPLIDWRGPFGNAEINALHAECFGHRLFDDDWQGQVDRFGFGWVTASISGTLADFVTVDWDGAAPHLVPFYRDACGFASTEAGAIALGGSA